MKLVSHSIVLFVFVGLSGVCLAMEKQNEKEGTWIPHSPEKALAAGRYKKNQDHKKKRHGGGNTAKFVLVKRASSLQCHESSTDDSKQ